VENCKGIVKKQNIIGHMLKEHGEYIRQLFDEKKKENEEH
jgi:hypothetical protein